MWVDRMSKEQFTGLFLLWSFIIILELVWLYAITSTTTSNTGMIVFIITLIGSTIAVGAVGIYLVSKHLD
ncbi:hypothetical protein MTP04_04300 [Lysinibacillus sp. PLM2]|nr:hypothetical protein MTP04_04300 [Lysinibacillus sp. PLM2]